jgi:DNA phosphorothioation-dependent restriction protein DptG
VKHPKTRRFLQPHGQCSHILNHLKAGKVLTTRLAVDKWECYRLSERIRELKARGHRIHSTRVQLGKKYWACYAMDL